jgi:hyperosmotically inducible protein
MKSHLVIVTVLATTIGLVACERKSSEVSVEGAPAAGVPAASTAPGTSVGTKIDDTAITTRVKAALLADPEIKGMDITVETRKSEVQLSGFVDSSAQIDRAIDIAKRTQGVGGVQNMLEIKKPVTVGTAVDDTIVTAKVKTALLRDDSVKAADITVRTNKGDVQLSGYVDNEGQITRATDVARSVDGVASVDNKMSVKR